MWVPSTDLTIGATLASHQPMRETWYDCDCDPTHQSVVESDAGDPPCGSSSVYITYGGWYQEGFEGFGGIVASAGTMLELANRYYIQIRDPDIGIPQTSPPLSGSHGGTKEGVNTLLVQRTDGINVFIFFNKMGTSGHYAVDLYNNYLAYGDPLDPNAPCLDRQATWPTTSIGGFWVDPAGSVEYQLGSYDYPYAGMIDALYFLVDGSRVNFKAGTSTWTGRISTKLQLRAPSGSVRIGD
jgi:hypothetical protein